MKIVKNYGLKKIVTVLTLTPSLAIAQPFKNNMPYPTTPLNENYSRAGLRPNRSLAVSNPALSLEEIDDENLESAEEEYEPRSGLDEIVQEELTPAADFGPEIVIGSGLGESYKTPEDFDAEM